VAFGLGAHYQRMYGEDFNPHYYALMKAASDHLHWAGSDWTRTRGGKGEHNALGGGHSHCGLMIYQGDNWPDEYRQTLMMANIHGNRLLLDRIHRQGSGYAAKHAGNFFMANDPWFRGVTMAYGPDGGVFVSDWNDLGECHDNDGSYRTSGRIYKITHGATRANGVDLARLSDAELVKLQLHKNDWFVRHARRLLQERHGARKLDGAVRGELQRIFETNPDVTRKLRAIWALNVVGGINDGLLRKLLLHKSEHIRWWAVKLIADEGPEKFKSDLERVAKSEPTSFVRLGIASALQRFKYEDRFSIAEALLEHAEDSADQNLPLMIWYALEPAIETHPRRGTELLKRCRMPLVRQFIARRLASAYEVARN